MIELIFVIVILGILAAVAIPKMVATRDDAKVSRMMMDLGTVTSDIAAYAASNSVVASSMTQMSSALQGMVNRSEAVVSDQTATLKMDGVDCISLTIEHSATNDDLNVSLVSAGSADTLCKQLQNHINVQTYQMSLRGNMVTY